MAIVNVNLDELPQPILADRIVFYNNDHDLVFNVDMQYSEMRVYPLQPFSVFETAIDVVHLNDLSPDGIVADVNRWVIRYVAVGDGDVQE